MTGAVERRVAGAVESRDDGRAGACSFLGFVMRPGSPADCVPATRGILFVCGTHTTSSPATSTSIGWVQVRLPTCIRSFEHAASERHRTLMGYPHARSLSDKRALSSIVHDGLRRRRSDRCGINRVAPQSLWVDDAGQALRQRDLRAGGRRFRLVARADRRGRRSGHDAGTMVRVRRPGPVE
jgi:hypothetical protein